MKLSLPRRLLRSLYRSLTVYGTIYTGVYPDGAAGAVPVPVPELMGPGRAHPERVCAHVPLTPLERALMRELRSG